MNSRSESSFGFFDPSPAWEQGMDRLRALLKAQEEDIDLGHAALAIAAMHYPNLSVDSYLERLEAMAGEAKRRIGRARRPERVVEALTTYLFTEGGFHGNRDDYYNPANSFLNEVLDRRTGLPITLSIVLLAIGHRLDLPLFGVGLPVHFVVKYVAAGRELYIDPFYGGEILAREGCQQRIESILARPIALEEAHFAATPAPMILYRLLNNLKQVYLHREEAGRAGRVVEQMLAVAPSSVENLRDLGLLALREGAFSEGIRWLQRYLAQSAPASDAEAVHEVIRQALERRARLN